MILWITTITINHASIITHINICDNHKVSQDHTTSFRTVCRQQALLRQVQPCIHSVESWKLYSPHLSNHLCYIICILSERNMSLTMLGHLAVFWLYVTLICSFLHNITMINTCTNTDLHPSLSTQCHTAAHQQTSRVVTSWVTALSSSQALAQDMTMKMMIKMFLYLMSVEALNAMYSYTEIHKCLGMTSSIMSQLDNVWHQQRFSLSTTLRLYSSLMQAVVLYGSEM